MPRAKARSPRRVWWTTRLSSTTLVQEQRPRQEAGVWAEKGTAADEVAVVGFSEEGGA